MEAHYGAVEATWMLSLIPPSYSSVKDVHGALEEPSGCLVAHPGASEVPARALEAHTINSKADFGA
jgi:hypothetical protein